MSKRRMYALMIEILRQTNKEGKLEKKAAVDENTLMLRSLYANALQFVT